MCTSLVISEGIPLEGYQKDSTISEMNFEPGPQLVPICDLIELVRFADVDYVGYFGGQKITTSRMTHFL